MLRISVILLGAALLLFGCKEKKSIGKKQLVQQPAQIDESATEIIQGTISDFLQGTNPKANFLDLSTIRHVKFIYKENNFLPLWSHDGKWTKGSDSLFSFIHNAAYHGLFPEDYHHKRITELRSLLAPDTASNNKLDASLWAETDLYLSMAFIQIVRDLKIGRLKDSSALKKDSLITSEFMLEKLKSFQSGADIRFFAKGVEPKHLGYHQLKTALSYFLPNADFRTYTYVNAKDSLHLHTALAQRLMEDSISIEDSSAVDSASLAKAIKQYQKRKGIKEDGKISAALISSLNETDTEKFIRVAITLDRYKQLPDSLPAQHIWVNIPGYYLYVSDMDTVRLRSKVVVGKSYTPTPVLTSSITDMITYPQWTIPESIIKKEILPGLKKNPSYTLKKGFSLIDNKGEVVDPIFVDWSKYKTGIPYKVVQGSGDDNALGVIKFNFSNKYAVYLHDTNQRYLFSRKNRALSHGCVRVQNWDSLAYFILNNDSISGYKSVPVDTLKTWLSKKQKHVIPVKKRIPLYIRYFSCEGTEDGIRFYEDIYGDDRRLKERYFANKNLNL